jgi:hypothetical protein
VAVTAFVDTAVRLTILGPGVFDLPRIDTTPHAVHCTLRTSRIQPHPADEWVTES